MIVSREETLVGHCPNWDCREALYKTQRQIYFFIAALEPGENGSSKNATDVCDAMPHFTRFFVLSPVFGSGGPSSSTIQTFDTSAMGLRPRPRVNLDTHPLQPSTLPRWVCDRDHVSIRIPIPSKCNTTLLPKSSHIYHRPLQSRLFPDARHWHMKCSNSSPP